MQDKWRVFARQIGNWPTTVMYRIVSDLDKAGLEYGVTTQIPYSGNENAFPTEPERKMLNRLEEEIEKALKPFGAIMVGHIFGKQMARFFYYVQRPAPLTIRVKVGWLKHVDMQLESRHDPQWTVYDEHLKATPEESRASLDKLVLDALAGSGDDHTKPRTVDFASNFTSAEARIRFIEWLNAEGFRSGELWQPDANEYWVEFHFDTPVEPSAITRITLRLEKASQQFDGSFDGWACHVEK